MHTTKRVSYICNNTLNYWMIQIFKYTNLTTNRSSDYYTSFRYSIATDSVEWNVLSLYSFANFRVQNFDNTVAPEYTKDRLARVFR